MSEFYLNRYLRLFEALNFDSKIELLARLTNSLKASRVASPKQNKEELLHSLFGAWADSDIDEETIMNRTISERTINFD